MNRQLLLAVALLLLSSEGLRAQPRHRIDEHMSPEQRQACGLHKLTPAELARLNEAFSDAIDSAISAGIHAGRNQPSPPTPSRSPVSVRQAPDFADLEGATIVADDGTYLGKITSNRYDSDSIVNQYGDHGGKYSDHSIFNEYGDYGGEYSSRSPFNAYTSTPPKIYKRNEFLAYLTVNTSLAPRVDPNALRAWLQQ
jgi:hypothetical protein